MQSMISPSGLVVVRLNGNFGSNFDGEIAGFEPKTAEYLLNGRFGKTGANGQTTGNKEGQPFAYPVTKEEFDALAKEPVWVKDRVSEILRQGIRKTVKGALEELKAPPREG